MVRKTLGEGKREEREGPSRNKEVRVDVELWYSKPCIGWMNGCIGQLGLFSDGTAYCGDPKCDVVHRQEYKMDGDHLEKKKKRRETREEEHTHTHTHTERKRDRGRTDPVLSSTTTPSMTNTT